MSEAPDRIWACVSKNTKSGVVTLLGDATFAVDGWQEYIRADRIEELEALLENLLGGAETVLEAWDSGNEASFRDAIEELRADVAEAKVDKP